jgi:hypothetical protein
VLDTRWSLQPGHHAVICRDQMLHDATVALRFTGKFTSRYPNVTCRRARCAQPLGLPKFWHLMSTHSFGLEKPLNPRTDNHKYPAPAFGGAITL